MKAADDKETEEPRALTGLDEALTCSGAAEGTRVG
jgi:hypothetical protein